MKRKWLLLVTSALLISIATSGFLLVSNRVAFLTVNTRARIELNGAPVAGEILENHVNAVVTTRIGNNAHSYRLFFEGDTDFTGDMGSVVDCKKWAAPRVPVLLETR